MNQGRFRAELLWMNRVSADQRDAVKPLGYSRFVAHSLFVLPQALHGGFMAGEGVGERLLILINACSVLNLVATARQHEILEYVLENCLSR